MNVFKRDHLITMIAAPLIWAGHFLACYVLVSLACAHGWDHLRLFGMAPAQFGITLATIGALTLIGYVGVLNFEKYRNSPTDPSAGNDISAYIALNAVMLCGIFTLALIWVSFPVLLLPTCAV